jgi:hypothetical protein
VIDHEQPLAAWLLAEYFDALACHFYQISV